jgi:hypothetical protein
MDHFAGLSDIDTAVVDGLKVLDPNGRLEKLPRRARPLSEIKRTPTNRRPTAIYEYTPYRLLALCFWSDGGDTAPSGRIKMAWDKPPKLVKQSLSSQ